VFEGSVLVIYSLEESWSRRSVPPLGEKIGNVIASKVADELRHGLLDVLPCLDGDLKEWPIVARCERLA